MCEMLPRCTMQTAAAVGWVAVLAWVELPLQPLMTATAKNNEATTARDKHRQRQDAELSTIDLSRTGAGADPLSIAKAGDEWPHFITAASFPLLVRVGTRSS